MSDTTSVPAISFTDTGLVAPDQTAIMTGVEADLQAAFGGNLNFTNPQTPQGQLATSFTAIIGDKDDQILAMQSNMDPAYNAGRWQDGIGRIYFLTRNAAQATVLQVSCLGASGVVIPVGATIQDTAGNIYSCTNGGTIGAGGTVTLAFANTVTGPIAVPSTVSAYQTIPGWDSVTVASGVLGEDVETRVAFEQRREDTVEGNSFGAIGSIIGAVAKVAGVTDYYGYDNGSSSAVTVDGVSVAANTIYICVQGGASTDVAQAILSKKAPGCGYTGTTTVTAYDNNPLYSAPMPYSVSFTIPTALPIFISVNLKNSTAVPSTALAQIQGAISAAFAGTDGGPRARIGTMLFASRFYAGIAALGTWAQIISVQIGTTSPGAANDVTVNANQIPTLNVANITLTLT